MPDSAKGLRVIKKIILDSEFPDVVIHNLL